jgi:mRNA-degrading endonuclease RelE of RelBE toxin-antitoxin system
MEVINSLKTFPRRCPIAPENEFFSQEIRQLLYGKGKGTYRILFTIIDDVVSVLHIRHSSQEVLRPGQ